jgi:putative membrane protein
MSSYDPGRWRSGLFSLKNTLTLPILKRAAFVTVWSIIVQEFVFAGVIPAVSSLAHSTIGVAFGLLLVFRTNTSYDRFWEGRRLWGTIIEESRNLARIIAAEMPADARLELRASVSVAVHATMHGLRVHRELGPHAAKLTPPVVAQLQDAASIPTAALTYGSARVAREVSTGAVTPQCWQTMSESMRAILLAAGGCARIRSTPIPFSYTVHLRRALILYCVTLPFVFSEPLGWLAIPATAVTSFILFGIEELGASIEDPFGFDPNDLPLETYCATVDATLFDRSLDALGHP